ncbi:hypothetical protein B5D80_04260 [Micromonospora wenchangensis]|uniref:Uncharacterized protein n=1 Tax=Micromonospora wenchangensis TaxID=1185415 RepID=A0A2D0AX61_9ACTN|nr:hypothetical protein B5D80_04260 [Micromonospora wenchangensis]
MAIDADPGVGVQPSPWQRYIMTDADEVLAFFQTTFADVDVLVSAPGPEGAELWGMRAVLGDVVLNDWQCSAQMRVRGVARGLINIIHVRSGRLCITEHGEVNQVAPGHTVLLPAGQVLELECDAVETLTVGLPTALVDEVARFRTETGRVRFAGTSPISIGLERHWLGTLAYVRQVVLADIALATNPLLIGYRRRHEQGRRDPHVHRRLDRRPFRPDPPGSQGRSTGTNRARRQGPPAVSRRARLPTDTDTGWPPLPGWMTVDCLTIEAFTDPPTRFTCGVSGATGRPRIAGSGPWVSPGVTPRGSRAPSARHRRTGTVLAGPVRCRCARIRSAYRSPLALTVRRWVE